MNKEHDICAECIESANKFHEDVDCMQCACKGCSWIHSCQGQCYK